MKSHTVGQVTFKWWRDAQGQLDAAVEYLGHEYPRSEVPDDVRAAMDERERGAVEQLASGFDILDDFERAS